MTDPMGWHWRQPERDRILLDDTHALMTSATFEELSEYSTTIPSGVYPGKMWRRHDGIFDQTRRRNGLPGVWLLAWFGEVVEGRCPINFREILLADGPESALPGCNKGQNVTNL
jgi:hypothetical protein